MKATSENIKTEIKKLKAEIWNHERAYYVLDNPVISDTEFDYLLKKLEKLEKENPKFVTADSPTQRVGGKVTGGFKTVKHFVPMLSLDNTYSQKEIRDWENRNRKIVPDTHGKFTYIVEPKIDGVSCGVIYEKGYLKTGATRGDGFEGEDVTGNIRTIRTIPLKLGITEDKEIPGHLEVRGEVYIDKSDFHLINEHRRKREQSVFANPRNAASGTLKLLDPSTVSERRLKFLPHSFGRVKGGRKISSHTEFYEFLREAGFGLARGVKMCADMDDVIKHCEKIEASRDTFNYEIDGMVIKIDDFNVRAELRETAKSPRWAISYKFRARQATTVVERITVQVGRTGVVTPVAELKAVECGGVMISRATLHNFEEVKRLGIGVGDRVLIERAGDVIPKVVKVTQKSDGKEILEIPKKCPVCGYEIVKEKAEEVAYRCPNPQCPAQLIRGVMHFASRSAVDIEGMGESAVEQFVEKGLINDLADIYALKKNDLLKLDLYAEKKADNLISSIEKRKEMPLPKFIFALGIRNVGEKAARTIAGRFGSLENLSVATKEELTSIPEVGPIMADSIIEFFKNRKTKSLLKKMKNLGVSPLVEEISEIAGRFQGKKFVFTGGLEKLSRDQARAKVLKAGGEVAGSVSPKTDYVVAGGDSGSKYDKARKLNIRILSEEEFLKLIEQ